MLEDEVAGLGAEPPPGTPAGAVDTPVASAGVEVVRGSEVGGVGVGVGVIITCETVTGEEVAFVGMPGALWHSKSPAPAPTMPPIIAPAMNRPAPPRDIPDAASDIFFVCSSDFSFSSFSSPSGSSRSNSRASTPSCFPSVQPHSVRGCPCFGQFSVWQAPGLSDTPPHPPVQM